jgi:hypothetical protein
MRIASLRGDAIHDAAIRERVGARACRRSYRRSAVRACLLVLGLGLAPAVVGRGERAAEPDDRQRERAAGCDPGVAPVKAAARGGGVRPDAQGVGFRAYGAVAVAGADVSAQLAACWGVGCDVYGAVAVAGADVSAQPAARWGVGCDVYGAVAVAGANVSAQPAAHRGVVRDCWLGLRERLWVARGRGRRACGECER